MPKHSAESLGALERKELQQIAKGLGLKQNTKSAELISQILAKQPSTPAKASTPGKPSSTPKAPSSASAPAAKAASAKKAAKQAKPTKRDASPAPQSAQKSSKRQRLEQSPAPAADAKAATPKSSAKKTPKASAKKTPKASAKKTPKAGSAKKGATPKTKATPKAASSKKSASKSVKKGGIAKTKTPGKQTTVTGITEEALELLRLTAKVIPAAADAALGADVHTAAAASKARAGSGRGSFAAKFAKIHEKNFAKMKPATAKSTKEVKAAKENKAFDFTAPPPVVKQASKAFNGVFTAGITAKQPFVPKADPLPVYVNPVKSVFSTAVPKKQLKPKFDLQASLSKGMPNTKVGPKVAIPPAKSGAAAAAAAAPDASPAKPVKSPVKQAAITRVTAGERAGKSAAAAREAAKARQEANRRRNSVELPSDLVSRTT